MRRTEKSEADLETAILLAAHGTTDPRARTDLDLFGAAVRGRFPGLRMEWAYTSAFVRRRLAGQGLPAPAPSQVLEGLIARGFRRIAVQSLHVVAGYDYEEFAAALEEAAGAAALGLGRPLLDSPADLERAARAVLDDLPDGRGPEEALVLTGHGTDHPAGAAYPELARRLAQADPNLFLGCLEGTPWPRGGIERIRDLLAERGIKRAWLRPFLALAGVHAGRDLTGPGPSSWASVLGAAGIETQTDMRGLCRMGGAVEIWLDHLKVALDRIGEDG